MQGVLADVRYAWRALRARPAFAIAAILTLGLGIGMTTAIFTVVHGVVLRPLPLRNASRLISICENHPGATADWCSIAPPNVEDIAARARSIEAIGIGRGWEVTLGSPDGPENIPAGIASAGMFETLGIRAELGRLIQRADLLGRPSDVAVITHELWQARYAGARDIIGRSVLMDGKPVSIVGVLEPGARVPLFEEMQLWRPLHIDPTSEQHREWRGFVAYARLRDGVSLKEARAEIATIARDLRRQHFTTTTGRDLNPRPLQDLVVGSVRQPLLLFFAAVGLVLLIACANVANLVLARGTTRGREIAIRSAIGGSRVRIVRALLLESLLLALGGAALGLMLGEWLTMGFKAFAPAGIPRIEDVRTDGSVMLFATALGVVTAVLFGLVPALRTSHVDFVRALREGGRGLSGRVGRLGRVLVVAELAVSLPLVTGAALLARSFVLMTQWKPGFEREHLATFTTFLPSTSYNGRQDIVRHLDALEREIASIPGVTSVGTASAGPLFGGRETWEMQIEGRAPDDKPSVRWADVSPSFFRTLGVPVVRGRPLGAEDVWGAPSTALVNETLANRFWPGDNPIGKRMTFTFGEQHETYTVVGVVRDVPPLATGASPEPEMYWSNRQAPRPFTYFVVRTSVPPASIADVVRDRVKQVNPAFTINNFTTVPELLTYKLRTPRFNMSLLIAFGVAALLLAGIGTYGLLAYVVEQRRKDIGIRMALGARREEVIRAVLLSGLTLAAIGVTIGTAASLALGRTIRGLLAGVSPHDPVTLVVSGIVVLVVAAVACLVPAWRASRVDPAVTLAAD